MISRTRWVFAILLAVSAPLHAQDGFFMAIQQQAARQQWQDIDEHMSLEQYGDLLRHNQRLMLDSLEDTASTLGVPKAGIGLAGAAIGFALDDDAKVNLNKSKTMALELNDVTKADRSVRFRMKFDW